MLKAKQLKAKLLKAKQLKAKKLMRCRAFPILRDSLSLPFYIYPLGIPAAPTVYTKPGTTSPLKAKRFAGLLEGLCAIHEAGLVHRGIRLANILMTGDAAKLIDFGPATAPTTSEELRGTPKTTSQAVLAAALQGPIISCMPEEDLDSFIKAFILHLHGSDIDYEEGKRGILTVFERWRGLLLQTPKGLSHAEMKAYLKSLLVREEAWLTQYKAADKEAW